MGHSFNCNVDSRWDNLIHACVRCKVSPGNQITAHCGYDDSGSRHDYPEIPCTDGTFNDGSVLFCRPCSACPPGSVSLAPCTKSSDTRCQIRAPTTPPLTTKPSTTPTPSTPTPSTPTPSTPTILKGHVAWATPFAVLFFIALVGVTAYAVYRNKKKGQNTTLSYVRRSSSSLYCNNSSILFSTEPGNPHLEDILSPDIRSAPLHMVLDNLDVLEELVILMDPESLGIKNTKHLASHCSFPSTWINYTYSMKDTKSPLKAVLEGVTSKHPDWTVGHLAKLLRDIERNDAIAVLCKLRVAQIDV